MSTYIDSAVDPEDDKTRKAWFIDDYYGEHAYGIAFRKDGKDVTEEMRPRDLDEYRIYPLGQVVQRTESKR